MVTSGGKSEQHVDMLNGGGRMKQTFNPCDECSYNFSKNNQEGKMCKICEFKKLLKKHKPDDFCEWEQCGDNLITSCGDYFSLYDNCTEKFNYCPKCGKKIKVVKYEKI